MAGDRAAGGFDVGERHHGRTAESLDAAVLTIGSAFCTSAAWRPRRGPVIFGFDDTRLSRDVILTGT
jgi:hypothetical protein